LDERLPLVALDRLARREQPPHRLEPVDVGGDGAVDRLRLRVGLALEARARLVLDLRRLEPPREDRRGEHHREADERAERAAGDAATATTNLGDLAHARARFPVGLTLREPGYARTTRPSTATIPRCRTEGPDQGTGVTSAARGACGRPTRCR